MGRAFRLEVCSWLGRGELSNCGILVSREHGGPEGMDPDGVIEVRNGWWMLKVLDNKVFTSYS